MKLDHVKYLKAAIKVADRAVQNGNHPFGAILVDEDGNILLEQGNVENSDNCSIGHAETKLMEKAGSLYSKDFLWKCTMYTTVEPCVMCTGACYWTNVGNIVYGIEESELLKLTGDDSRNPTLSVSAEYVISKGQKDIKVVGPVDEVKDLILGQHINYWKK